MDRYERNILRDPQSSPIRLLFVIFRPMDDNDPDKMESISHTVAVLKEFKKRNNGANIEYIFEKGDFSRAVGLHSGVMHVGLCCYTPLFAFNFVYLLLFFAKKLRPFIFMLLINSIRLYDGNLFYVIKLRNVIFKKRFFTDRLDEMTIVIETRCGYVFKTSCWSQ